MALFKLDQILSINTLNQASNAAVRVSYATLSYAN